MDIGEINMVANRKRINVDAEKLRDKVSRETAKIIKLKVAQDTAYWDLKEKLQQVESNHERLQQNMVEVQMQHETMSGQYQEELRLRPDTLNKLGSSREISEVLQEYCERLKETLSRCKVDQVALCDAYQRSGEIVREMKQKQLQESDSSAQTIASLEERVKLTGEHQSQLMQMFAAFKQQAESELSGLRQKVQAASAQEQLLTQTLHDQIRQLDQQKFQLEKKEEAIANLQKDIKQVIGEYDAQGAEARAALQQKEKDLKETIDANDALKEALANQEQYTTSVCDQNTKLIEKVAGMEEEHQKAAILIKEMKIKVEEASALYEGIKKEMSLLIQEKESYVVELRNKEQVISTFTEETCRLKEQLTLKANDHSTVCLELEKSVGELESKTSQLEQLTSSLAVEAARADGIKDDYENYKNKTEETMGQLTNTLESKEKELNSKASTITQLMAEMKAGTDARGKLEAALQRLKRETDAEREESRENTHKMTAKIEHLEASVKDKDEAVSKQMSIIMEMRSEKERLQEKIQGMQNTIDNIQKELTGRPAPPQPADLDDNAVMLTPSRMVSQPLSPILNKNEFTKPKAELRAEPRAEPRIDNMLYHLFSDSSMEGDTLDASEVNRRFHAISRGERVSPRPLSSLKRRSAVPVGQARSKVKATLRSEQGDISLSQVKNDMKNKERTFFKTKHLGNKMKKPN